MQTIKRRRYPLRSSNRRVRRFGSKWQHKKLLQTRAMHFEGTTQLPRGIQQPSLFSEGVPKALNPCPVCGYNLPYEPADYNICLCCGTEFGYDDSGVSYDELRSRWVEAGAKWWSIDYPAPKDWNATKQLIRQFGVVRAFQRERPVKGLYSGIVGAMLQAIKVPVFQGV